jgi:hypothetical protein
MNQPEGPPLALATAVSECGEVEEHVRAALQQCNSAPNAVKRLALSSSWLALGIAIDEVCTCAALYPASPAAASCAAAACARVEDLHFQLERRGLLPRLEDTGHMGC